MSTCMQKYDASRRGLLDGREHAREVKAFCFAREVRISVNWEVDIRKYLVVVGPCWGREVHRLTQEARIEFREKQGT